MPGSPQARRESRTTRTPTTVRATWVNASAQSPLLAQVVLGRSARGVVAGNGSNCTRINIQSITYFPAQASANRIRKPKPKVAASQVKMRGMVVGFPPPEGLKEMREVRTHKRF